MVEVETGHDPDCGIGEEEISQVEAHVDAFIWRKRV